MRFSLASLLAMGWSPSRRKEAMSQVAPWLAVPGRVGSGASCSFSRRWARILVDDVLVLDASDDFDRSAAAAADFDFCIEYSLESLSPSHSGMALGGGASFCVGDRLDAFPTLRWCDQPTTAVVRCQDAMVAGEVNPSALAPEPLGGQRNPPVRRPPWVVPSRYGVFKVYRTLPVELSERRGTATAGLAMYRHSRSRLSF